MGEAGYIYLIERSDGWYKIGRTGNLEQRFRSQRWELSRVFPRLLGLVQVENSPTAEKMFHRIFDDLRTDRRHNGLGPRHELFRLEARDLHIFWMWAGIIGIKFIKTDLDLHRRDWLPALRVIFNTAFPGG